MKTYRRFLLKGLFMIAALSMLVLFTDKETSAATMTLKASKNKSYSARAGKNYYARFKAGKTGYVEIRTTNTKYITLVNSKHKKVAACQEGNLDLTYPSGGGSKSTGYLHYATYGVKKGKTYYLKLTAASTDKSNVKFVIKSCRQYAAKKKALAYTLKKGKQFKNAVLAGKKKTWWFKYKATTDYRSLILEFNSSNQVESLVGSKADASSYTVDMYDASGNLLDSQTAYYNAYLYDYHFFGPAAKKGSWIYIKVRSNSKYNSGWFYLKATDQSTT